MDTRKLILFSFLLISLLPVASALTAQEYEELGRQSAQTGQYGLAAQHYSRAADAYRDLGNNTAAAVNYERAATFFAYAGSSDEYLAQAGKAASSYAMAGEDYLEEEDFWVAANAFARSAAFYNATDDFEAFMEMQIRSGDTYVLAADYSGNTTEAIQSLYQALQVFHGIDDDRFLSAEDQLKSIVEDLKEDARKTRNPVVFDLLEVYYLPVYTQLVEDDAASAERFEEMGHYAESISFPEYAGSYYTTAAVYYSDGGNMQDVNRTLGLAADSYEKIVLEDDPWNYTTYLYVKVYLEESLFIGRYLGRESMIQEIQDAGTDRLDGLLNLLVSGGESLFSGGKFDEAASNLSAAAEISYVLGSEDQFRQLNERAGWAHMLAGQEAQESGDDELALSHYEESGFLLRIAGNQTYTNSYSLAAEFYGEMGDSAILRGNLSEAASDFYRSARYFTIAGNDQSASGYYGKYIKVLRDLMESEPQSKGFILVSIGDAQMAVGEVEDALDSYAQASDELVQLFGQYISTSADLLLNYPGLPINLVKSYRLSERYFLARNMVESLDMEYLYGILTNIAPIAQTYRTASSTYYSLAQSDLSVYDFQSYSVNTLFSSITAMLSGDLDGARARLKSFESLDHPLQSSNRKFYELLSRSIEWLGGEESSLAEARKILDEILSITEESDLKFLLRDIGTFLESGGSPGDLIDRATSEADAGNLDAAGELFRYSGVLRYFSQNYSAALSSFEDSAYNYLRAGRYSEARSSANRAFETMLDPPEFASGLLSLSEAYLYSNRTLASIAKASFKASIEGNYRVEESRELSSLAEDLEGTSWGVLLGQVLVGLLAALAVVAAVVFLRGRSGS